MSNDSGPSGPDLCLMIYDYEESAAHQVVAVYQYGHGIAEILPKDAINFVATHKHIGILVRSREPYHGSRKRRKEYASDVRSTECLSRIEAIENDASEVTETPEIARAVFGGGVRKNSRRPVDGRKLKSPIGDTG